MITELDERKVERIAREHSLVNLILRGNHHPPFPLEVWHEFSSLDGGRGQMIGLYVPAYERAYTEAVKYLQDINVLTTVDDGAYVVFESKNTMINPQTPDGETLYFVDKGDAEQYSRLWRGNVRIRKLSSD